MTTEEKLSKAVRLADAMYYAAQQLSTDASHLSKAMKDWWNFKNVELKESEDEKTRKRIIALVNAYGQGMYKGDMLAWLENIPYTIDHEKREGFHLGYKAALEKQGGKSLTVDVESMMEAYEQRLINQGNGVRHSPIVNMCVAAFKHGVENTLDELHLKQGDSPIKWNKNTEGNKPQVNHSVLMKTTQGIAEGEWKGEYWEQYRWAGIVRDSDVLSWIELSDLDKQGETVWSEETDDDAWMNDIISKLENNLQLNKAEIDWLKSLKQRYTWKPSDEQMEALFVLLPTVSYGRNPAFSLYNDLKKLKGE